MLTRCHFQIRLIVSTILVLLFIVTLTRTGEAATFDPSKKWQTLSTDHFRFHFALENESVVRDLAVMAEEVYETLTPKLEWRPFFPTEVVVTDNHDKSNGMATVLPYNWMLIRLVAPPATSTLANYDNWLKMLFMHEYTHILHLDQNRGFNRLLRVIFGKVASPNGLTPTWIKEGLAVYEETVETTAGRGRGSYSEMLFRTAVLSDTFPHIDQADGVGWKWPAGQLPYHFGVGFLSYLADTYGAEKLIAFNERVSRSPVFFMMNRHAKKIFGKTFYVLWREWETSLREKYAPIMSQAASLDDNRMRLLAGEGGIADSAALSPDGKWLVYSYTNPHQAPEIRLRNLESKAERPLLKNKAASQISFHPDGESMAFSIIEGFKRYNAYFALKSMGLRRTTADSLINGKRAHDPSYSPDGKEILFVQTTPERDHLVIYHVESKKAKQITLDLPRFSRFSNPAWSPKGDLIAVSGWINGQWDLYILSIDGKQMGRLTDNPAIETTPSWNNEGSFLYFASDESGISNIYRYQPNSETLEQLSNVATGVYSPIPMPNSDQLIVRYYTGDSFELRTFTPGMALTTTTAPLKKGIPNESMTTDTLRDTSTVSGADWPIKKYNAAGKSLFLPQFLLPGFAVIDNGFYFSGLTGGADPLKRHTWLGGVSYRTDAKYLGEFFTYSYTRYRPSLFVGFLNYAANFGDVAFRQSDPTTGVTTNYSKSFFEKRYRGFGGFSYPWGRQAAGLQYFYEDRRNLTLSTAEVNALAPNLGKFAGLRASYIYGSTESYPASISTEKGTKLNTSFSITDRYLASNEPNEQQIFAGDLRRYVPLPWLQQVLAMRVAGGIAWGDTLKQGTFGLGGSLGEGPLTAGSSLYYFPLRGLPISALAKTRAMLGSVEYRFPLLSPQRGLGTWPFYLKDIHFAPFADYGNAWNANESSGDHFFGNFFLSTGAELRADFVLGHGLPVVGRLGYGIVVVNRDRLGTLTDPITGAAIKNGMLVLQLGTSF